MSTLLNLCKKPISSSVLASLFFNNTMLYYNSHAGFERERFYECLECQEPVSNPLCHICLAKQVDAWLSNYPSEIRNRIIGNLKGYVKKTRNIDVEALRCIACNKKTAALCPYCFTNHVFNELKKMKVARMILKEFLQFFNYDFEHVGYSREAERLGVI